MTLSHNKKAPKCLLVKIEEVRVVKRAGRRKQGVLCLIECTKSPDGNGLVNCLLNSNDQCRIELLLNYLEDGDLRQWRLLDVRAFNIGILEWRSKLNSIINPHMYDQLLEMNVKELLTKGNSEISAQKDAAKVFLKKAFKLRLGRGFYGECQVVKADSNPDLSDEIGKELSLRSAAAGLSIRPSKTAATASTRQAQHQTTANNQ